VQAYLEVLHTDIVYVWNLDDPHHVIFIFRCFVVYSDVTFGAVFGEQGIQDVGCEIGRSAGF